MKRYVSAGSILPASGSATRCCNGSLPVKRKQLDRAQQGSFQVSRTGRDDDRCGKGGFPYLLETEFTIDDIIVEELRKHPVAMDNFSRFPELYKRVKIGNIQMKRNNSDLYWRRLDKFIRFTCRNKMYGEWNDNGRLSQIYENK